MPPTHAVLGLADRVVEPGQIIKRDLLYPNDTVEVSNGDDHVSVCKFKGRDLAQFLELIEATEQSHVERLEERERRHAATQWTREFVSALEERKPE